MESFISLAVEDYLNTSYWPDCDYVDGVLVERNVGLRAHSVCVGNITYAFYLNRAAWGSLPLISQRVRVSKERIRVADVCVVSRDDPNDAVVIQAPLLCAEILSPDDAMTDLQDRVNDYAAMGVKNIWAADPWRGLAYYCSSRGLRQSEDGFLAIERTRIKIALSDIFRDCNPHREPFKPAASE